MVQPRDPRDVPPERGPHREDVTPHRRPDPPISPRPVPTHEPNGGEEE